MKRILLFISLTSVLIFNVYSQTSLNDLNIIFKHDFENNTLGDYIYSEWQRDWLFPRWSNNQSSTDIVQDISDPVNSSKALQINYAAGTVGAVENGAQWWTSFNKVDEIYVSYDVQFMPGFQFQLGGKMPSVQGGTFEANVKPTGYDGFSGGLMFHRNGLLYFYIYYPDSKDPNYGDSFLWGSDSYESDYFSPSQVTVDYGSGNISVCTPGEWHNITYRMVLNTVKSEGGGNYDGILEAYFDGKLVSQFSHFLFRHTEDLGIDCMRLYSFFGGSTDEWRTPIDEWMRIDNVLLYTFKESINVPHGNVLSPTNRTINYWRLFSSFNTEPPSAPSSLAVSGRTRNSITLKWTDNSKNEYGFKIYRSVNTEEGFSQVGSVTSNVTSFTDNSLQPGTTYYYRLQAYNDVGYSSASSLTAATIALQLPAAPSGLSAPAINFTNATLSWSDKSTNETGFQIERSGPDDFDTKKVITVASDIVTLLDTPLQMNGTYQYRVRAYNTDGFSDYSNMVQITTPYIGIPSAPSSLKGVEFTDKSISIAWKDNSTNESSFVISRSLATDPSQTEIIKVKANATSYKDTALTPSTSYVYTVRAVNIGGNSALSNKDILATLSFAETQRVKNGLIAYYNFTYNPEYLVHDLSGYDDPVNLKILKASAVDWKENQKLSILSGTALVSQIPAKKIITAIKKANSFSFECWIKPSEPDQELDSRIVSLGSNDSEIGFVLIQSCSMNENEKFIHYSTRTQTESTNESGYPEMIPDKSIDYINLLHLTYIRDSLGKESLFMNGAKTAEGYRPSSFNSWSDSYNLRVGNESDMNHPWQGTLYSIAFYNRALSAEEISKNYSLGPCDSLTSDELHYQLDVFPNPLQDEATIEITPTGSQDFITETTIRIFDVYGNIKYHEVLFNPTNRYNKSFDFRNYAKGIYFLQILSGNQHKTTKFVIQ